MNQANTAATSFNPETDNKWKEAQLQTAKELATRAEAAVHNAWVAGTHIEAIMEYIPDGYRKGIRAALSAAQKAAQEKHYRALMGVKTAQEVFDDRYVGHNYPHPE